MTEQNTAATTETAAVRGRKPILDNVSNVVAALVAIQNNDTKNLPSRRTINQLVEAEYLVASAAERAEGQRGRSKINYELTQETKDWLAGAVMIERETAIKSATADIAEMLAKVEAEESGLKALKAAMAARKADLHKLERAAAKAADEAAKAAAATTEETPAADEAATVEGEAAAE